jgi:hypothetical protein
MDAQVAMGTLLLFIGFLILVLTLLLRGRKGPEPAVRSIPPFQSIQTEIGHAAESGGAIHIALGSGALYGQDSITSLAGLQIVESLVDTAVSYGAPPIVTVGDPTLLPLAQDVIRRAYERNRGLGAYDPNSVRFVAPSPIPYAAGAASVIGLEKITSNVVTGAFGAEASLVADAAIQRDLPSSGAVGAPASAGVLYPTTDQLAVGEELYSAGAQMTNKRHYLVSLVAHDILRLVLIVAIFGSAILAFLGR